MTKKPEDGASPMVGLSMSRRQAEKLFRLVEEQPQQHWRPVAANILRGLKSNAGAREYPVDGTFEPHVGLRGKR